MYTLDTNTIIYFIKGDNNVVATLEKLFNQPHPIYISAITELELFSFSRMSFQEIEKIEKILDTIAIIPIDSRIARIAGPLRQRYRIASPDSAIAATALFTGTILVTRDIRDFAKIPNLKLLEI